MMKEVDIASDTNRFKELATLCPGIVRLEYMKIAMYFWCLPEPIHGLVTTSKPTTYDNIKRIDFSMTNHKIRRGTMARRLISQKCRIG